ncbi:MAG: amidohydrolase [Thermoplasmatales archaeon]|nr:amidohydrolase [Thermoplasmatales archaeon]MCW6169602.1 amidohydrolase [Thermoplasmatales archaeon]
MEKAEKLTAWDVARQIFELSEIGSQEVKSSKLLEDVLEANGFNVQRGYMDIPTSFRAEMIKGKGEFNIAFLAEYDALPGIGHACGHNLIAAANVFAAIEASKKITNGKIIVLGTPDEEGSGKYSGSKILLANKGAFNDIDLVLGAHPGDRWDVGDIALAVQDLEVVFKGVAAHEAASPEKGKSALDGAILTYTAVNMLRQHVKRDKNVVIHGIIKEGGQASNVTPEKASLVYGIRSSDVEYEKELINKFKNIVYGCSIATETTYEIKEIGPLFLPTKINPALSNFIRDKLLEKGVSCQPLEQSLKEMPSGSTDFANVSQLVPALELGFKIADAGTPWHSRASLAAAGSESAKEPLNIVISVLSQTAYDYTVDKELRKRIDEDFKRK